MVKKTIKNFFVKDSLLKINPSFFSSESLFKKKVLSFAEL